jgi:hypothetical protein
MGVRVFLIQNRIDENYGYANKVSALAVNVRTQKTIFLDSDMLCLRVPDQRAFFAPFSAKPADLNTWSAESGAWAHVYRIFDLDVPQRRVVTTVSGKISPPYFNAGVIAVDSDLFFAEYWEDSCIQIDRAPHVPDKRPWLDQIALPVAITRLALDFRVLTDAYNFPAHLKPLPKTLPVFCHYHWPAVLRREPVLRNLVQKLTAKFPRLEELIRVGGEEWQRVLETPSLSSSVSLKKRRWYLWKISGPHKPQKLHMFPEVLITGIPRSGTSLLCRLLHEQSNCVVLNEPAEIFGPLTNCENPWWLACYYRELRRDILEGAAVHNKVVEGKLVEDTRQVDHRERYHPIVSRPDFLLGTKNTLVYLARMPILRRALPQAPIVACVRHPLDTLASWKDSFPHLRDVQLSNFPVSYADNDFLTGVERQRLQRISDTESAAQRRALLWSHLAELIATHRDSIILLRYEDLVREPEIQVRRILSAIPDFKIPALSVPALTLRSRREILDTEDLQAAADLCAIQASYFGYDI